MDIVSPEVRSRMMAGIRSRNTRPEVLFRKGLHQRGYRYRLHPAGVPGKPDFVLPRYRVAAFVHGCFWHQHDCALFNMPKTRREFWQAKLGQNRDKDAEVAERIAEEEWRQLTIWECALRGRQQIGLDAALDLAEQWLSTCSDHIEIRGRDER